MPDPNENVVVDPEIPEPGQSLEPSTVATEPEVTELDKTPITDEYRKKWNVPEKFKFVEDVIKSYGEAEKTMSKTLEEKSRIEKQNQEYEEMITEMEAGLEKKKEEGVITEEQKQELALKFREEFDRDPFKTLDTMLADREKWKEAQVKVKEIRAEWAKEKEALAEKYGNEKFYGEVLLELTKISTSKPYLQSLYDVEAIYEQRKNKENASLKEETERKNIEKKKAEAESGFGAGTASADLSDKMREAKSFEELEKLATKIPKTG